MSQADMPTLPALGRRHLLQAASLSAFSLAPFAHALPPMRLQFPRDAGAHPDFQTEWWYITGYANAQGREAAYGFQLTFFRSRVAQTQGMRSGFAAKQLIFAHAAITDVQGKKLWHDQRTARWSGRVPSAESSNGANVDLASASTTDTDVILHDWSLKRVGTELQATLPSKQFKLQLRLTPTQPVLLQGKDGLSRKGPDPAQASYYYSQPQLVVQGTLGLQNTNHAIELGSRAWLDHEWSQALLHPNAVGWDWIGMNLTDGSTLTAFRLRDAQGQALWDGGSFRSAGKLYTFGRGEVTFQATRFWTSPISRAVYGVEWTVRTPADFYTVKTMVDNQELDSRASTGAIYWEGLCTLWDSNGRLVGRGYLEMTGYAKALRL
jgi:predicted secreted hydrolase